MTVLRRNLASVPRRTASETWLAICELVSEKGSDAWAELEGLTDVAAQLIAQEAMKNDAAVFSGVGPQVRIYTLHDDEAIEADPTDEQGLVNYVAEGDWSASLPADPSDLGWASRAVEKRSTHVSVREADA